MLNDAHIFYLQMSFKTLDVTIQMCYRPSTNYQTYEQCAYILFVCCICLLIIVCILFRSRALLYICLYYIYDRGIIPNEHLASGTDEPWSTWRSLNRLRVQKERCRAMVKMWKLSHTDVCDCGERQTMSQLMTCVDAPNSTWADLAIPTLACVKCAKHWEESI